jgi:hypothetical protein
MVGTNMYRTGTYIQLEQQDLANRRVATTADRIAGKNLGIGPDGRIYAVDPKPNTGTDGGTAPSKDIKTSIKVATSNLFVFTDENVVDETLAGLIFEDIGGHELLDMTSSAATYSLGGQAVDNQVIPRLSELSQTYSPMKIIAIQDTLDKIFAANSLNLLNYIPQYVDPVEVLDNNYTVNVLDIDLNNKERVEVEVLTYGNIFDATIYT